MITDNTAKWRVGSISTPQVNSGDGLLPVGHVYYSMGSSAPTGSLPLWGQLFSRSTYKDLWDWVNKHPEQLLSESEWQTKYIENNGLVPFYSEGTDSTNFRVPNVLNFGTDGMDFVVDEGKDGYNWYRVWKSGWVEQGGTIPSTLTSTNTTITFPKAMQDTSYFMSVNRVMDIAATADSHITVPRYRGTDFARVSVVASYPCVWFVNGYGADSSSTNRVLWCVKAFGNIDEGTGSTSLDSIATNIAQLNTKVDNWVSGTLDSHATAIAEMQSYFNGSYEKTLLAGSETTYIGSGDITLSDSWKNYDGLLIYYTNDANNMIQRGAVIWKYELENVLSLALLSGKTSFTLSGPNNGQNWYFKVSTTTELVLANSSQDSGIQAIYGIRLKATGITNKSAIDVSQMSEKISSLLTPDNHLRLPSGLEVW